MFSFCDRKVVLFVLPEQLNNICAMRIARHLILIIFILGGPAFAEEPPLATSEPATKTLMWSDGTRYVGGVVDGKRTGKGTIFWQDGTRFVGNFKNDGRNGPGTMILPDGTVYNGIFKDDELISTTTTAEIQVIPDTGTRPAELSEPVAEISAASLEADTSKVTRIEKEPRQATTLPPQDLSRSAPITRMSESTRESLESMVDQWAADWSNQDVDRYLAHYSDQFRVPGRQSRNKWQTLRRSRLERPAFINVSILFEKLEIVGTDLAEVTFRQTYESDRYGDVTRKRLDLVRESEKWLIKRERSI